ncbi:MAG: ATP-dependent DNA helicase RecQ [Treponema sp.]|nr:ATP-dependent DNA helicase RecQ [Treponema sp.]
MEEKVENQDALDEAVSADAYINQTDDQAVRAAQKAFGITTLFPWQRIVVANILDAASPHPGEEIEDDELNDVVCRGKQIVLLPTGAGKSLCFLTPALLLDGPTLVIYPLLALMSDQKRRMDSGNMVSVEFRGGQSAEERENNFRLISEGAKIILANPEVLQNEALVERLSKCGIRHIAIDEAHCVSEWGDSFRPAYLTLGKIISKINAPAVTAFTATASPQVLERVSEVLFGGNVHIIRSDCDRPNIHFHVVNAFDKKREAFKLAITQEKPLLIFCGTRAKSEDMARELTAYYGREKVRYYHAGLERDEKTDIEKWFYERDDAILCCTCAYGMGVDKKNIHTVIHLESPSNVEAYIQESGRAARDGSIGNAILLWSPEDSRKFASFGEKSREHAMLHFAEADTCRRQILLDALGGEQAPCDGCDVCERKGPAPFARDAEIALSFIRRHRKMYTKIELRELIHERLNEMDRTDFGENIWEVEDADEILLWLQNEGYIKECIWPWHKKIDRKKKIPANP